MVCLFANPTVDSTAKFLSLGLRMKGTKTIFSTFTVLIMLIGWATSTHAILIQRTPDLIYDTHFDITWLLDANYAASTTGIPGFPGFMTWDRANSFVGEMNAGTIENFGFTNWRLPTTMQPDLSCSLQLGTFGFLGGCIGSEMGHLYNIDGVTAATPGPFRNLQNFVYWSGTELTSNRVHAWEFDFTSGDQGTLNKTFVPGLFTFMVRDGDVPVPIPEPGTLILLNTGVIGILVFRRMT